MGSAWKRARRPQVEAVMKKVRISCGAWDICGTGAKAQVRDTYDFTTLKRGASTPKVNPALTSRATIVPPWPNSSRKTSARNKHGGGLVHSPHVS